MGGPISQKKRAKQPAFQERPLTSRNESQVEEKAGERHWVHKEGEGGAKVRINHQRSSKKHKTRIDKVRWDGKSTGNWGKIDFGGNGKLMRAILKRRTWAAKPEKKS